MMETKRILKKDKAGGGSKSRKRRQEVISGTREALAVDMSVKSVSGNLSGQVARVCRRAVGCASGPLLPQPTWSRVRWEYMSSVSLRAAETIVNVLDFKKDVGLWHGILTVSATPGRLAVLGAPAGIRVRVQGDLGKPLPLHGEKSRRR